MITNGFTYDFSDVVVLDTKLPYRTSYIYIVGAAGDLVYENIYGEAQWIQNAAVGYHPITAQQILSSGTVNGTPRTTTATGLFYCASARNS